MIHHCRICGLNAGGLVRVRGLDECDWPEPDLCPACVGKPEPEDEGLKAIKAVLEKARQEVQQQIKKEREGEYITADIMQMILY